MKIRFLQDHPPYKKGQTVDACELGSLANKLLWRKIAEPFEPVIETATVQPTTERAAILRELVTRQRSQRKGK